MDHELLLVLLLPGLASRFQLARYSQFYFRVTLKRKRKVKVAAKLAFY